MYTNPERHRALILIFSLAALAFIIWLMLLILVWLLFRRLGSPFDLWAMTGALSTALGAAAVIGGGYVAYRELAELASSRHLEIADKLFDELNSQENIEARRWVFQNLQDASCRGHLRPKEVFLALPFLIHAMHTHFSYDANPPISCLPISGTARSGAAGASLRESFI